MRPLSRKVPLFALFGLAIVVPALAQDLVKPGEAVPAACTDKDVTPDRNRRASDLYKTGRIAAENGEREKGIFYYLDAYRADCTGHGVLLKIAELWELKGNKPEALRYTNAYLERAPKEDANYESATVRRERLKREIAAAPAASTPPTPPAPSGASSAIAPPTGSAAPTASDTAANPPPPSHASSGHTALPWSAVGVGGAAVVTGVILGAVGAGKVSTGESTCHPLVSGSRACTNPAAVTTGNSGRTLEAVGLVSGIVGAVLVGGGLAWHFLEPTAPKGESGARVVPEVSPGYAGLSMSGRF